MYSIRVRPDFKPTAYTDGHDRRIRRPRPCSIARALDIVGEKWALLAVREVFLGNRRFDEMIRRTGAPRDTLAARLRTLVGAGSWSAGSTRSIRPATSTGLPRPAAIFTR